MKKRTKKQTKAKSRKPDCSIGFVPPVTGPTVTLSNIPSYSFTPDVRVLPAISSTDLITTIHTLAKLL